MRVEIAGRSDKGRRRRNNEDCIWIQHPGDIPGAASLLIVADGMGGAAAGEVASAEAVKSFSRVFYDPAIGRGVDERLRAAAQEANTRIYQLGLSNVSYEGMGSTLVAAAIDAGRLWVANVGDSRCYLVRRGFATQLTHDHSWVAEQIRAGQLTEAEAASHPNRNAITRCLGAGPNVEVDSLDVGALQVGDVVVLCSDGLSAVVSGDEIAANVTRSTVGQAVQELVSLANQRGGPDNISVVVAQVEQTAGAGDGDDETVTIAIRRPRRPKKSVAVAAGSALTALAAGAAVGVIVWSCGGGNHAGGSPAAILQDNVTRGPTPLRTASVRQTPGFASVTCKDNKTPASKYVVSSGESLSAIAISHGLAVRDITNCDPYFATHSKDEIGAGQTVLLPTSGSPVAGGSASNTPPEAPAASSPIQEPSDAVPTGANVTTATATETPTMLATSTSTPTPTTQSPIP